MFEVLGYTLAIIIALSAVGLFAHAIALRALLLEIDQQIKADAMETALSETNQQA